MKLKYIILTLTFTLSIFLVACGSNDDDIYVDSYMIKSEISSELSENSQEIINNYMKCLIESYNNRDDEGKWITENEYLSEYSDNFVKNDGYTFNFDESEKEYFDPIIKVRVQVAILGLDILVSDRVNEGKLELDNEKLTKLYDLINEAIAYYY